MAIPTLSSVSPSGGPPGTAITLLGAGFDPGAQVGCPALVATERISASELRAMIPSNLSGPAGSMMVVSVYVQNEDGSISTVLPFSVTFSYPAGGLQSWTTVDAVAAEVPGFRRGGRIGDEVIETWIRSIAQAIAGAMLRRGLSLIPAHWQAADPGTAMPTAAGVLELINRTGAAARLASAVASEFTQGEWALAKSLQREYERDLQRLDDGIYDRLFRASESPINRDFAAGDIVTDQGGAEQAFSKTQVF